MQADMDELVHVKFKGVMAEMLIKVDADLYTKFSVVERGKTVIYAALSKALYGTLRASLLFWQKLSAKLQEWGYKTNPYDWCVVNKEINGKQCIVLWHVDDLKVSHINDPVLEEQIKLIEGEFAKEAPLTIRRGNIHDYLGMTLDYSQDGKVLITMLDYIQGILDEVPESFLGKTPTPAANHLFDTEGAAVPLDPADAKVYYHHVMQLLYLCKRARPDLQLPVAFLSTRVKAPDSNDWKKLWQTIRYLNATKLLPLTLEADSLNLIKWFIDMSFAVHADMRSHTGGMMTMGKGCIYGNSSKQRLNTKSSTEAELLLLVGVSDLLPQQVIWTRHFLMAQGYQINESVVYQDNQSAILLEKNGRASSRKHTRHINIRYFFITDRVKSGEVNIKYCPTNEMIADFFTKPLQGAKFRKFRDLVLNIQG